MYKKWPVKTLIQIVDKNLWTNYSLLNINAAIEQNAVYIYKQIKATSASICDEHSIRFINTAICNQFVPSLHNNGRISSHPQLPALDHPSLCHSLISKSMFLLAVAECRGQGYKPFVINCAKWTNISPKYRAKCILIATSLNDWQKHYLG